MKKNIFETFLNKVFNVPLWVKQVMYIKLAEEMQKYACEDFLKNNKNNIFSTYVPTITFKGKIELTEKECGLDNNIYNFLQCCSDGLSILEISINTFLSMEEVAKYFELCMEQDFINVPNSKEIQAMSGFIAGKYRLGEYLRKTELISDNDLEKAVSSDKIAKTENSDKKFGEILVQMGIISEDKLKSVLKLKEEAPRRFILDYNTVPVPETKHSTDTQEYKEEIEKLKKDNVKLKQKMLQLVTLMRKNADSSES